MTVEHFLDLIFGDVLIKLNKMIEWIRVNIFHLDPEEE